MSGRPPPLTEDEKKARLARIQADHDAFIRGIATMQSLPRLQSTIAGAGGKTNVIARMAQEREVLRTDRLHRGLEENRKDEDARKETLAKAQKLEAVQSKKRQRRVAKKQRQKTRAAEKNSDESDESDGSVDASDVKVRRVEESRSDPEDDGQS